MRILILNADYEAFLGSLYNANEALRIASYGNQMLARNESLFSTADFYSRSFHALGHEAADIHVNNPWLQSAWAREHGLTQLAGIPREVSASKVFVELKRLMRGQRDLLAPFARRLGLLGSLPPKAKEILLAQIEAYNPDVVFNQDVFFVDSDIAKAIKKKGRMLVCYCGIAPPKEQDFRVYDLCLSMLDWVVTYFRRLGIPAEKSHLAFEPSIIERLGQPPPLRDIEVSFIGSLSTDHSGRIRLLEQLAAECRLDVWMPSLDALSGNSPLRARYRGPAYGRAAYEVMRRSRITLNSHVGAARGQAANMRHFEATGVGALLLTDNDGNLADLFEPDRGVVVYRSESDALRKINHYLLREDERSAIAQAAQAHTLAEHTYQKRARNLVELFSRYAP